MAINRGTEQLNEIIKAYETYSPDQLAAFELHRRALLRLDCFSHRLAVVISVLTHESSPESMGVPHSFWRYQKIGLDIPTLIARL